MHCESSSGFFTSSQVNNLIYHLQRGIHSVRHFIKMKYRSFEEGNRISTILLRKSTQVFQLFLHAFWSVI